MKYVFGWPFMTSRMKIFNFWKRFYQKVAHCKVKASKTTIEPLKLLQHVMRKVLVFKPIIIKARQH